MKESLESVCARAVPKADCSMPNCRQKATRRPVINLPKLEGVDNTPPRAELEFVLCDYHAGTIDPSMFLSLPVRLHLENVLVKLAGRPILKPVDWSAARVVFEKLPEIVIVEG